MQAVIAGILGISELHKRNASPVHICCASELNAKLWLDERAETETAKASTKPAWRSLLVKDAFISGSHWHREAGPFLMGTRCAYRTASTVTTITISPSRVTSI